MVCRMVKLASVTVSRLGVEISSISLSVKNGDSDIPCFRG
jgi:hypothetical protein